VFRECGGKTTEENRMGIGTILLVILVLAFLGVIPTWSHSKEWGYGPSGGVGLILLILVILLVLGKI
jgi:VIT1/CCC1 family predicted Fe2+/Mn2+ transporter